MHKHELFNQLIKDNGFKTYLEIGVDDPNSTFNHVRCSKKIGVDPYDDATKCHQWNEANRDKLIGQIDPESNFHFVTSDEYFNSLKRQKFDIIFIDGMHTKEQVEKDVQNSLARLNQGGIIFIDDVCPNNQYEAKTPPDPGQPWRGSVWEYWANLRSNDIDLKLFVIEEMGIGIIMEGFTPKFITPDWPKYTISFEFYEVYRKGLMNEIPLSQALEIFKESDKLNSLESFS